MAFAAGLGSLFGAGAAGGGLVSAISTIGSLLGAVSSFFPKDTPDVPMQPVVNIPKADPLPAVTSPSNNLTDAQKLDLADAEKRRRTLLKQKTNTQSNTYAGLGASDAPLVQNTTLLGS